MNKSIIIICTGLTLLTGSAQAQWGNWGMPGGSSMSNPNMMPWGGSRAPVYQAPPAPSYGGMMPWGGSRAPVYQAPPPARPYGGMMPWGGSRAPVYQAPPPAQPYGSMMPWGAMSQPQVRQPPPSQGFMMPGMDQGIRSMMQPGKIMAEEATPGMHIQPTWR